MHNAALAGSDRPDPPPFSVLRPRATAPLLLVCDHASNIVPHAYGNLGLSRVQLERHIGWDIGAAEVTRHISDHFRAVAVLSGVSRLVIDCNRPIGHPTSIPAESDGVSVRANRGLTSAEIEARAAAWFHPYHGAIRSQLARIERGHEVAALISIHSFTPAMDGKSRPWSVGVLWDRDPRIAIGAIAALRQKGHVVGDNEPYSGRGGAFTVDTHAADHGRPHVAFEIRQDLVADAAGARFWGRQLCAVLAPLLGSAEVGKRRHFP